MAAGETIILEDTDATVGDIVKSLVWARKFEIVEAPQALTCFNF
jgi:hypothetical protein